MGQRSVEVPVGIVADSLAELDETVSLELRNPTGATLGEARTHDLKISANILPRISFSTGTLALAENVATQPFPVQLDTPSDADVLFAYSVTGSATFGVDHNLAPDMLVIPRGTTTVSINAPIINDGTDEEDETIDVALTALSGAVVGQNRTRRHVIVDEDLAPNVGFTAATGTTAETGTVTITVNLAVASAKTASVDYAVNPGSASAADFTATAGKLTFAPGETSKTFTIAITDDTIDEADETFTISLTNLVSASDGGILNHNLTITDNDTATLQFTTADSSYDEDDEGVRVVQVNLSTTSSQAVSFDFTTSGSATRGNNSNDDYQIPNGPFSIPAGATTFDPGHHPGDLAAERGQRERDVHADKQQRDDRVARRPHDDDPRVVRQIR